MLKSAKKRFKALKRFKTLKTRDNGCEGVVFFMEFIHGIDPWKGIMESIHGQSWSFLAGIMLNPPLVP